MRHFEQELDVLRTTLIRMASLVDEQIDDGVKAIITSDIALAKTVISRDREVDMFDNEIDHLCMRIFALTQPVAVDLRLLMAALKINNELERIGDIAVNLAERVEPLAAFKEFVRDTKIETMAVGARSMVKNAIDAFVNSDANLARTVLESDDNIDKLDAANFNTMIEIMEESPKNIVPGAHIMMVSRHIERLADHATNIAEDVIFIINARIIKHHADEHGPL
jgi:phosphate transport system protein